MNWWNKRKQKKQQIQDGLQMVNGTMPLKYILCFLPDRMIIHTSKYYGVVNKAQAAQRFGDYFVWSIEPHSYDIKITLHDKGEN